MWRNRITVALVYFAIFGALMCAVFVVRINAFARMLNVNVIDIFASLPSQKTQDGAITFLITGISGDGHDGPTLTDSITVAQYNLKTKTLHTIGIPRDIWNPHIKDKINSIYTYGLQQNAKTPLEYAKGKYKELFDVDVDYMVVINFSDFEQLIDMLGGITVNLEKGFSDPMYPKDGAENEECIPFDPEYKCRYQTLIFRKGVQRLNGSVALKFVRSRHAEGDEGSDFSRSKRQQMVLNAVKARISEIVKERDMDTMYNIIEFLNTHIKRDISNKEALALSRSVFGMKVNSQALPEELFEVPPFEDYEGRYVLIPKNNDYEILRRYIKRRLNPEY